MCHFTQRVAEASGLRFQYLIATMYVESGLNPDAVNGHAKGIAQIKPAIWKETVKTEEFKRIWNEVAAGKKVPAGPGISFEADVVVMAAISKKREDDCNLANWWGDRKDQALRLCYHLNPNTGFSKVKQLQEKGTVDFSTPHNQKNWNRFLVVLDKAKLTAAIIAAAKTK